MTRRNKRFDSICYHIGGHDLDWLREQLANPEPGTLYAVTDWIGVGCDESADWWSLWTADANDDWIILAGPFPDLHTLVEEHNAVYGPFMPPYLRGLSRILTLPNLAES